MASKYLILHIHCTLYTVYCRLYYTVHCILYTVLYCMHCINFGGYSRNVLTPSSFIEWVFSSSIFFSGQWVDSAGFEVYLIVLFLSCCGRGGCYSLNWSSGLLCQTLSDSARLCQTLPDVLPGCFLHLVYWN